MVCYGLYWGVYCHASNAPLPDLSIASLIRVYSFACSSWLIDWLIGFFFRVIPLSRKGLFSSNLWNFSMIRIFLRSSRPRSVWNAIFALVIRISHSQEAFSVSNLFLFSNCPTPKHSYPINVVTCGRIRVPGAMRGGRNRKTSHKKNGPWGNGKGAKVQYFIKMLFVL